MVRDLVSRTQFVQEVGDCFHVRQQPTRVLVTSLLRLAEFFRVPLRSILLDPADAAAIRPLYGVEPRRIRSPDGQLRRAPEGKERLHKALKEALGLGLAGKSLAWICREQMVAVSSARHWFPDLASALVAQQKRLRRELSERQQERLQALTVDDLKRPDLAGLRWHVKAEVIAERLVVPIYMARARLAELWNLQRPSARSRSSRGPRTDMH
ncbi:hypothetical protein BTJ49_11890 [Oleiagrimonas sp. MCCC 1A03011]|nr:hypothetical protein BTJ49_11890 [Oleiagrimonas sp. MCCC 1A03011]